MDEHKQILEMVAEGKITVEEGTKLLDALRDSPPETRERIEVHHVPDESTWSPVYRAVAARAAGNIVRTRRVRRRPGRSVDRIVSFASHGISPDYVRDMHEVFDEVSSNDLISLSSMDVTPDYVERVKEAFGDEIGVGEVISLASMDVSPEYIEALAEAGFETLTVKDVLKKKIEDD